ncbi:MAG TPA: mersacidin/lichenicidin family type 2 lantibiotic [Blastocatellia bacterium]|nr:mersacidin/lichenicidin family type 2 lantibiotic [Blastocatellia bacterium]
MNSDEVIRAWKDEEYRLGLSEAHRSALPQNPVGLIELNDGDLGDVSGGTEPVCETIIISLLVSALLECKDSILHGTCSGLSIGCCKAEA